MTSQDSKQKRRTPAIEGAHLTPSPIFGPLPEKKIRYCVLLPAYGRQYLNINEFIKDFKEGKDFRLKAPEGSTYCSIRDFDQVADIVAIFLDKDNPPNGPVHVIPFFKTHDEVYS